MHVHTRLPFHPVGLVAAAVVLASMLVTSPAPARADDRTAAPTAAAEESTPSGTAAGPVETATSTAEAGDTLVGELVQAYADPAPAVSEHEDETGHGETGHGETGHDETGHDETGHDETGHDDTLLSWVQTGSGETVRVSTTDVGDVESGATVQVTLGAEVQDAAAIEGMEPAHELLSTQVVAPADQPATAPAVGAVNHEVTVVLLQPGDAARDSTTLAAVTGGVSGAVADFWQEQTAGAVRFGVVAGFDWTTTTATCSDPFALWRAAADRAGWTAGDGKHLLVYVPAGAPGCSYGLGTLGTSAASGGLAYVQAAATSVVAHEFGHNLGLNHSSQLQCAGTVEEVGSSGCQISSYRDYYDVMGISWDQVGSLSALQANALGVLPAGQQAEMTSSSAAASYTLSPISGSSGTRAVKLTASTGATYWLEYRPASGRDSWLTSNANVVGVQPGVLLRRAYAGAGDSSLLLDASPSGEISWERDTVTVLPVGSEVALAGGQFRVKVTGVSGTTAAVDVRPANRLPVASWDALSVSGSTLSVRGWAFDPDQPLVSGAVHVYVDGRGASLSASGTRTDVGRAFPGVGDAHGFSFSTTVAPGAHRVCVFAVDVDLPSKNTSLGCRSITRQQALPVANWDALSVSGSTLSVRGWAFDPDQPLVSGAVHVYVDGRGASLSASGTRTDVGRVFPGVGDAHGFSFSTTVAPGAHRVCVFAVDVDLPSKNTSLGCRSITRQQALPVAYWDALSASGSTLSVRGWAFDPDQPLVSGAVHVYVDGRGASLSASGTRTDVGRAFPGVGDAHGFSFSRTVAPGPHRVCVFAIDVDLPSGNTSLGCRSITTR
ncbi:reprolysin-like metallopeptidase [uncultured Modestobacter sp.]|uniref:reprolysin-like metallopeptidase n=1 Tax=uncultured Modestobacter sp. TaxID=380048 RepID=UPI0026201613|nr:hypothetical protein [uncultured Modestobacter sp.]